MVREQGREGFTLIEMSIVLVVIGLIVGGVLVGHDMIRAATVRAQISQIEKYNTAVNTFRVKYNSIPGDMNIAAAEQFGFVVGVGCTGAQGGRDGNGLIDGWNWQLAQPIGETGLFWADLTSPALGSPLIDGQFPEIGCWNGTNYSYDSNPNSGIFFIGNYFPAAKIGHGNYVYVYENGGSNWFAVSAMTGIENSGYWVAGGANIPVIEAYNIDKKIDDGLPTTGNIMAIYLGPRYDYTASIMLNASNAASDNSATCYNNVTNNYSLTYNAGAGANCALSFRFQ